MTEANFFSRLTVKASCAYSNERTCEGTRPYLLGSVEVKSGQGLA